MTTEQLANLFAQQTAVGETSIEPRSLAAALTELLTRAKRAWPGISLSDQDFAKHLATQLPPRENPIDWLKRVDADIYLAWACVRSDSTALSLFEQKLLPQITAAIAAIDSSHAFVSEVLQQIRHRLLIQDGNIGLKLSEYAGLGPLSHWLRAVAVRTALNARRSQLRQETPIDDELLQKKLPSEAVDLELQYLKDKYRVDFTDAFRRALARLSAEDRALLRLCFVDELTLSQIGAAYGADKSTISRRLAKCRKSLLELTGEELTQKLQLRQSEAESLMHAVQSQLNVSLKSLFESYPDL